MRLSALAALTLATACHVDVTDQAVDDTGPGDSDTDTGHDTAVGGTTGVEALFVETFEESDQGLGASVDESTGWIPNEGGTTAAATFVYSDELVGEGRSGGLHAPGQRDWAAWWHAFEPVSLETGERLRLDIRVRAVSPVEYGAMEGSTGMYVVLAADADFSHETGVAAGVTFAGSGSGSTCAGGCVYADRFEDGSNADPEDPGTEAPYWEQAPVAGADRVVEGTLTIVLRATGQDTYDATVSFTSLDHATVVNPLATYQMTELAVLVEVVTGYGDAYVDDIVVTRG